MINFSLMMTPESTVSVDGLCSAALPGVLSVLAERGYAVSEGSPSGWPLPGGVREFSVGPGLLRVSADGGGVEFALQGPDFGIVGIDAGAGHDAVLWMRLLTLGLQLQQAHAVVAAVSDPEFPAM